MSWIMVEVAAAKEAYDAYAQSMGRVEMWTPWVNLTAREQEAWVAAARAVEQRQERARERRREAALHDT